MRDSLTRWLTLDESDKRMPPESELLPAHRWEDSYPEDGLILRVYTRDLPQAGDPHGEPALRWNRDHVWYTNEEMRMWLPDDPRTGDAYAVPRLLLDRLTRFHLVDNVNGQTIPFNARQVRDSELMVTVTEVTDSTISLHLEGETLGNAPGPRATSQGRRGRRGPRRTAHGLRMRLVGDAGFDTDKNEFTRFDLTGLGTRWGRTENNGRRRQTAPSPIGVTFELAPRTEAAKVGPAFVGPDYAEWVVLPEGMTRR